MSLTLTRNVAVLELLQQVEWCLGDLSRESCVHEYDSDYQILQHNFTTILDKLLRNAVPYEF